MRTEIIKIDPADPDPLKLSYCGAVLRYGGLVVFPTETVYGLGVNALNASAAVRVFEAKGRPADNPLIVHVCDYSMAEGVAEFQSKKQWADFCTIGAAFWPGPLTMVVGKKDVIPDTVSCGLKTVGIRMPSNKIAAGLIRAAGVPVAAPSANTSGRPSPTDFAHVFEDMNGRVDVIIDGGSSEVGVESTVLDLCREYPAVLRPGAVTREDVAALTGRCDEPDWTVPLKKDEKPRSPGMKYRHYAPKAAMTMFSGPEEQVRALISRKISEEKLSGKRVGILATDEQICYYMNADIVCPLGPENEPEIHAARLFGALRKFDAEGADVIFAHALEKKGIDDAVMNRMFRAAGGAETAVRPDGTAD